MFYSKKTKQIKLRECAQSQNKNRISQGNRQKRPTIIMHKQLNIPYIHYIQYKEMKLKSWNEKGKAKVRKMLSQKMLP